MIQLAEELECEVTRNTVGDRNGEDKIAGRVAAFEREEVEVSTVGRRREARDRDRKTARSETAQSLETVTFIDVGRTRKADARDRPEIRTRIKGQTAADDLEACAACDDSFIIEERLSQRGRDRGTAIAAEHHARAQLVAEARITQQIDQGEIFRACIDRIVDEVAARLRRRKGRESAVGTGRDVNVVVFEGGKKRDLRQLDIADDEGRDVDSAANHGDFRAVCKNENEVGTLDLKFEVVEFNASRQRHDVLFVRCDLARNFSGDGLNRRLSRKTVGTAGVRRFRLGDFNAFCGLAGETQMLLDCRVEFVNCRSIVDAGHARIFDRHGNSPLNKLIAVKCRSRDERNSLLTQCA